METKKIYQAPQVEIVKMENLMETIGNHPSVQGNTTGRAKGYTFSDDTTDTDWSAFSQPSLWDEE